MTPDLKDDKSDLLIIGGEDHKVAFIPKLAVVDDIDARLQVGIKTDQNKLFTKLEAWAKERWPQMGEIEFKWSGDYARVLVQEPHCLFRLQDKFSSRLTTSDSRGAIPMTRRVKANFARHSLPLLSLVVSDSRMFMCTLATAAMG